MATLRWSVWNPVAQKYAIYESQGLGRDPAVAPAPPMGAKSQASNPVGVAPEVVMPTLPFDATQVGESDVPVGRIAQAGTSWSTLALAAGAAYVAWKWWKKRGRRK